MIDLYQGIYWETEDGTPIRITDMAPRHAYNASRWLERHAQEIAFRDSCRWLDIGSFVGGEQALRDLDRAIAAEEIEKRDPVKWIKTLRLWQVLNEQAKDRDPSLREIFEGRVNES